MVIRNTVRLTNKTTLLKHGPVSNLVPYSAKRITTRVLVTGWKIGSFFNKLFFDINLQTHYVDSTLKRRFNVESTWCVYKEFFSSKIYLFKVSHWSTRKKCENCSKLRTKTQEQRQRHHWSVYTVNCGHISPYALIVGSYSKW